MNADSADEARRPLSDTTNLDNSAAPLTGALATVAGEALLKHLSRIAPLAGTDAAAISKLPGDIRVIARGHDIDRAVPIPGLTVLLSGLLHRYATRADGSMQIHDFVLPGEAVGLDRAIMRQDHLVCASVDSRVALIPLPAFRAVVDEHPTLTLLLWRAAAIEGAMAREWLLRNSLLGARARMAHLFCEIFSRAQAAGLAGTDDCAFPATQELLARALGMTSVHVNRTLQVLRDKGVVDLKAGRLRIADFAALAQLAGFDPRYLHLRSVRTPG